MNPYFIIISFNTMANIDIDAMVKVFNQGLTWCRCVGNSWLMKTTSDIDRWYRRIEPLLGDEHEVFICRLVLTQRQGLLPDRVWKWIEAQTPPPTDLINPPDDKTS